VFRGLRHLIRLLVETVLDLWTILAQFVQELDNLGDYFSRWIPQLLEPASPPIETTAADDDDNQ